jgi:hypothetical protein
VLPTEEATLPAPPEVEHSQSSKPRSRSGLLVGGVSLALGSVGMGAVAIVLVVAVAVFVGVRWSASAPDDTPIAEVPVEVAPADGTVGSPDPVAPSDVPEVGSPEVGSPEVGSPEVGSPEVGSPEVGSPAPAPAPQPATTPRARPAPVPSGTVQATGEADAVWLEGPTGRVELGVVPVGQYRVMASFKGEASMPAGSVTVEADQVVTLACSAAFQVCKAR